MLLGVLLVFFLPLLMSVPATPKSYAVVSIVDITGVLSCLIKVHSVLKSSQSESRFVFKFLVLNTTDAEGKLLQLEQWNSIFAYTFPSVSFESKLWSTPSTMPKLRQKSFEKDYIFSRFYLPEIFADVDLYVYLDNDLVVTADLVELFETPLTVDVFMPTSGPARPAEPVSAAAATSSRLGGAAGALQNQHKFQKLMAQKEEKKRAAKIAEDLKRKPPPSDGFRPCIGFVYERHTDYNRYIEDNFNKTHPLVVETKNLVLSSLFMNGGVALVNASCWRERGMRRQAEELMSLNTIPGEEIYGTGAGDQAVFYLLLQHRVTYLHARWNMRRLPTKTVHMLAHRQMTGVVHYAGYTHGNAVMFCSFPLHLPLFTHNVVPLYLAVAASFANRVHALAVAGGNASAEVHGQHSNISLGDSDLALIRLPSATCNNGVTTLLNNSKHHTEMVPNYFPGLCREFKFPPGQPFP